MTFRIITSILLLLAWAVPVHGEDDVVAQEKDEQQNAQVQQYIQMIQPILWRELESVRLTCELTPEQRVKIKTAGDKSVDQAARNFIKQQRRGGSNDPRVTVRKDVAKVLQETLTAEQLTVYTAESTRRAATRKKAAIASVVAHLDSGLYLTKKQRDDIAQTLETNWKDDWEQWLALWQYGGRCFPEIPDRLLTPHLSEEQTKVWNGFQKVSFGWWGSHMQRQPGDDEWWTGNVATPKRQADASPNKG